MEYSPSATVGETGYWGNKYGNSDVSNRFQIWNWKSKNGRYSGNLGGKYYYPITNKDTGDVAIVRVNPQGDDYSIGTIKKSNGDFVSYNASRDENYYFNLPENADRVKNQALFTANKEYNAASRGNKPKQTPQQLLYNNATGNANVAAVDDAARIAGGLGGVADSVAAALGTIGRSGNIAGLGGRGRSSGGGGSYLAVPAGIEGNGQDYMEIVALKSIKGSGLGTGGTFKRRSARGGMGGRSMPDGPRIILPIPGGINDSNGVDWGDGKMTAADVLKAQTALAAIREGGEGLKKTGEAMIDKLGTDAKALKPGLEALIAGAVSGNAQQLMQRSTGEVMNPNLELLFSGPTLRTFTFNFKLSPRNAGESQTIVKIITWFKKMMAVKVSGSDLFLKSPNTWKITYKHRGQDHKYLNKFKECAMTNCAVQYTDGGNYSTYEDGAMTSYGLGLTFREMEPIFQGDYTGTDEIGF